MQGFVGRLNHRFIPLVITQLVLLTLGLTLGDVLYMLAGTAGFRYLVVLFLCLGAVYLYLVRRLLLHFYPHPAWRIVSLFLMLGVLFASFLAEYPGGGILPATLRPMVLTGIHSVMLGLECVLAFVLIREVFVGVLSLSDRLWATAAAYLCMAIAFGSLFDLIHLAYPRSFGFSVQSGFRSYAESIHFSLVSMVKMPEKYAGATNLLKAVALIQAVWNDLFVALLVGNILAKK